jgi:hypothetical protein
VSKEEDKKLCLHAHPRDDRLDNSLAEHINMETMLAVQLSQAHSALRATRAALSTASKKTLQDRSVRAALAVIDDALP